MVRARGEASLAGRSLLVRYIDDFVVCFQYREDALRVQDALRNRLGSFGLTLEPTKTKLVDFGRFAQRHASKHGRKRPETIYFLGFTLSCARNLQGNFKVGTHTEKSRFRRSLLSLRNQMRQMRHQSIQHQVDDRNVVLLGHYAYYGVAGNIPALQRVYRAVERYWCKMLRSRRWAGHPLPGPTSTSSRRGPRCSSKAATAYRGRQAWSRSAGFPVSPSSLIASHPRCVVLWRRDEASAPAAVAPDGAAPDPYWPLWVRRSRSRLSRACSPRRRRARPGGSC